MFNLNIYREVKSWKKPVHASRTLLAKNYLKLLPHIEIIGITGSVGKTLTQNAIYSVLSQKYKVVVGDENLDPTFRIPKTILSAKPWHQKMVLEYGVERPGEMDHYLFLVKPKIAVVTAIFPTHTKYLGDIEGVFNQKAKLITALPKNGHAVLSADDPLVVKMADLTAAHIWWFGKNAQQRMAHLRGVQSGNQTHPRGEKSTGVVKISHFIQTLKGSKFRLHYNGQKATVSWKVIGRHQLLSAYAAATVGIVLGLTLKQIAKGLSQTKPPEHRLAAIVTKNISILDDTYNASPKAAQESLATLIDLGRRVQKIAVFGEMKDLGRLSEKFHQDLGQKISRSSINHLITIGKVANLIGKTAKKYHFKGKVINVPNTFEAISEIRKILTSKSLILVKGSRHAHLERIVNGLLGRSTRVDCYHCGGLK